MGSIEALLTGREISDFAKVSIKFFESLVHTALFKIRGHPSCLVWVTQHDALPCFASFCFVLYGQNKPLTYVLIFDYNTGCNRFAQCPWGISYMCIVWNGYSYSLKNDMLEITKHPGKAKQCKTRQDKTRRHPDKTMFPGFDKYHIWKETMQLDTCQIWILYSIGIKFYVKSVKWWHRINS